jgi:hypothetical protein
LAASGKGKYFNAETAAELLGFVSVELDFAPYHSDFLPRLALASIVRNAVTQYFDRYLVALPQVERAIYDALTAGSLHAGSGDVLESISRPRGSSSSLARPTGR